MRGSVRRQRQVAASAEKVWALVGRPELLHEWFPGITASPVDGDTRTITTATGLQIAETILTNDPIQRRFQYRVNGGLFRDHLGTIDVIGLDDASSLVAYASDCEPAALALVLGGATQAALDELCRQMEGTA